MDKNRYPWDLPLPEYLRPALERLGHELEKIANRKLTATQSAVPACASCGGKLGGCYFTRKKDGRQFCVACGESGVPEEIFVPTPAPGYPCPDPPHTTAAPEPPRSRCCNTDTFTAEGRVICAKCRLGCRTR